MQSQFTESSLANGPRHGRLRWIDLAAEDSVAAIDFYREMFGWACRTAEAGAGTFNVLAHPAGEFASVYQLNRDLMRGGVPSHWTPYVDVDCLDSACNTAERLGSRILVREFRVPGRARIALIQDPVNAVIGLWEPANRRRGP